MTMMLRSALVAGVLAVLAPGAASARTGVLVLRDGMQSEYAFCREDEWGGWGKRHPVQWMFRAGLLDYAHRFERYLAPSPGLEVHTLDLEAHTGELPLGKVRLVVVDDVRASVLKPVATQLADFVDRGGSLIVVGGFQGFGGEEPHYRFSMTKKVSDYRDSGLAHILPLEIAASPDYVTTAKPKVEFSGAQPLGTGLDAASWPLYGFHRAVPKPTARVLATIDRAPLVAFHAVGSGYVVAFTGSELEAAFAAWNADPWVDGPAFWQRMAALALGRLDVGLTVRVPPPAGPALRVEAEASATGQMDRTLRVEGWAEDADGAVWPLRGPESLRVEVGKSATWAAELPLKDVPPGAYRAFVRVAT